MKWVPIIGVAVIILAIGAFFLMPSSVSAAILYIESGTVEVNTGKGWVPATDEMELKQGAQIKTTEGEATVVLREGEIVHLQPNSEIKLDQIGKTIKITQVAGETWNKVTKISGVSEFSIETPTTVATVRGTEFILNNEELTVGEGEVDYGNKADKKQIKVKGHKKAMANLMTEEDMSEADIAKMQKFPEKYIKALQKVRAREIKKQTKMLKLAKNKETVDKDIDLMLKEVDEGKQDEEEIYHKAPSIMKPRLKRTYELTKEIKRMKAKQ